MAPPVALVDARDHGLAHGRPLPADHVARQAAPFGEILETPTAVLAAASKHARYCARSPRLRGAERCQRCPIRPLSTDRVRDRVQVRSRNYSSAQDRALDHGVGACMRATAPTEPAKIATSGISRQHDRDAGHYTVANQRESPPPDPTRRDHATEPSHRMPLVAITPRNPATKAPLVAILAKGAAAPGWRTSSYDEISRLPDT